MLTELRRSREPLRGWRWCRITEPAAGRTQTRVLQAVPSAPLVPVFSCKDEGNSKGPAPDCEETRASQDSSPNEVIETSYPTLVNISYINFARHKGACKVERDRLLEKGKIFVEIEKGLLAQGGAVLSLVHKEQNPEVKSTREIENGSLPVHKERNPEATSARVIGRGSRKTGNTEEVVVSGNREAHRNN